MAKYNFGFKKKIVLEHQNSGAGSKTLAKKYNVSRSANGSIIMTSLVMKD